MKYHFPTAICGIVFVSISAAYAQAADYSLEKPENKKHRTEITAAGITASIESETVKSQEQKNLDLSLPDNSNEVPVHGSGKSSFSLNPQPTQIVRNTLLEIDPKKSSEGLHLKGGLLLSPDPEAEKQKLVDGARIVFSLRR